MCTKRKHSFAWAATEGTALYDIEGKTMRSLVLVYSGAFRSDKTDLQTGAVVEWRHRRADK